jgi:hypothetical protein
MDTHRDEQNHLEQKNSREGTFVWHEGKTKFAYLDETGQWREFYTHQFLKGEVRVTSE